VDTVTGSPAFAGSSWGVCAQWAGCHQEEDSVFQLNPSQFFIPASNTKMFTIAAAQQRLGAERCLETSFWLAGRTLCVKGGGDPTLTYGQLLEACRTVAPALLQQAPRLDIVVDVSVFGRADIPGSWDWSYLSSTSGFLPSSLTVGRNSINLTVTSLGLNRPPEVEFEHALDQEAVALVNEVTTVQDSTDRSGDSSSSSETAVTARYRAGDNGVMQLLLVGTLVLLPDGAAPPPLSLSIPCLDPDARAARLVGAALEAALAAEPSAAKGSVKMGSVSVVEKTPRRFKQSSGRKGSKLKCLHVIRSAPLGTIMRDCMQPSDNLYAECLLRLLSPPPTSLGADDPIKARIALVADVLTTGSASSSSAVDGRLFWQADGSGLSKQNQISPLACVQLLQSKAADTTWRNFFPIAGMSGTLAGRFHSSPAAGKLHAKTGTLHGVSALSGYYKNLVFSIMVNGATAHVASHSEIVEGVDKIALALCAVADAREQAVETAKL
jgi:D-alanyl-D-alanine carboxypeptidase/D-alanyl-D-alanine-endopeptidase (penicillin-binding protein 4)